MPPHLDSHHAERVAAGVSPAVEPGRLARRERHVRSHAPRNRLNRSVGQDASLYGRRDARRYVVAVSRCIHGMLASKE
jgi:hypothetical protein